MTDLAQQMLEELQFRAEMNWQPFKRDQSSGYPAPDRAIRRAIAELRDEGHPIIAHPKGGYYYSDKPEDIRKLYDQCRARLVAHARTMKAFRGRVPLLPDEGQEVLALLGEGATDEGGEEACT